MTELLALCIPSDTSNCQQITAPGGIPTGGTGVANYALINGIVVFITLAIIVGLFSFIYSGIQWITSGGDKQKIAGARRRIIFTVVGIIIMFMSAWIVQLIGTFFGIKFF